MTRSNLLVVAAIAVLGLGITLSVSSRLRRYYQRIACNDHLRAVGLSIHTYEGFNGYFPPGSANTTERMDLDSRLSWYVVILPYVEGDNPAAIAQFDRPWYGGKNAELAELDLRHFAVCPSGTANGKESHYGITHFVGIAGIGGSAAKSDVIDASSGVFGYNRRIRVIDIEDGLSNTLMVLETSEGIGPWIAAGWSTMRGVDTNSQPYIGPGNQFGGNHKSTCSALFADGSVHNLSETIEPALVEALATIKGHETFK